ncbi:hypothetical protein PspLS_08573 [Pyricularia sp. CBS 133598]|nr:hypothetical protein PspLS_08573 [Pyricularia sp. CBS 133598]
MHLYLIPQALSLFAIAAVAVPIPGGRSTTPVAPPAVPEVHPSGSGPVNLNGVTFNPRCPDFSHWNFFNPNDDRVKVWIDKPDVFDIRVFKHCHTCGEYPFHDKHELATHLVEENLAGEKEEAIQKANKLAVTYALRWKQKPKVPPKSSFPWCFSCQKKAPPETAKTTIAPPWNFD